MKNIPETLILKLLLRDITKINKQESEKEAKKTEPAYRFLESVNGA